MYSLFPLNATRATHVLEKKKKNTAPKDFGVMKDIYGVK
jgi:hypothetical protein